MPATSSPAPAPRPPGARRGGTGGGGGPSRAALAEPGGGGAGGGGRAATGWPRAGARPEPVALLGLRKGLFVNLRPVILSESLVGASPLRPEIIGGGVDILILRELTGGLYYGRPKGREPADGGFRAVDTMVYSTPEIE